MSQLTSRNWIRYKIETNSKNDLLLLMPNSSSNRQWIRLASEATPPATGSVSTITLFGLDGWTEVGASSFFTNTPIGPVLECRGIARADHGFIKKVRSGPCAGKFVMIVHVPLWQRRFFYSQAGRYETARNHLRSFNLSLKDRDVYWSFSYETVRGRYGDNLSFLNSHYPTWQEVGISPIDTETSSMISQGQR